MASRKKRIIIACCLAVIVLVAVSGAAARWYLPTLLRDGIASYLSEAPGVRTQCGDVVVRLLGGELRVDRLSISVERAGAASDVFGWQSLTTSFEPSSFVGSLARIHRIEVAKPMCVLDRGPDGTWNISPVLRALMSGDDTGPGKNGLVLDALAIRDGKLTFIDHSHPNESTGASLESLRADASVYYNIFGRGSSFYSFEIQAGLLTSESGRLEIAGTIEDRRHINMHVVAAITRFGLKDVNPYCEGSPFRLEGGTADVQGYFRCLNNQIESRLTIRLRDVKASMRPESPRDVVLGVPARAALRLLTREIGDVPLNVEITGNLQDPKFGVEHEIVRAIGRAFTRRARHLAGLPLDILKDGIEAGGKVVGTAVRVGASAGETAVDTGKAAARIGKSGVERAGKGLREIERAAGSGLKKAGVGAREVGETAATGVRKTVQTTEEIGGKAVGAVGSAAKSTGQGLRKVEETAGAGLRKAGEEAKKVGSGVGATGKAAGKALKDVGKSIEKGLERLNPFASKKRSDTSDDQDKKQSK